MDIRYIAPASNMVLLLTHPLSMLSDLELFWELTDRLWCGNHPVYFLDTASLDETCHNIDRRLQEVTALGEVYLM